jgi:hypothetical protein
VAALAASLFSVDLGLGTSTSSHDVLATRNHSQMGRIHTAAHPTEMVDLFPVLDWTDEGLIDEPMRLSASL